MSQTRITSKVSLDAVSSQLSEKNHELSCTRSELERVKAQVAALESQQRSTDNSQLVKVSIHYLYIQI